MVDGGRVPDGGADRAALVQEILSAIPAGCSWLLPVTDRTGRVVDFTVAATSERVADVHHRGVRRLRRRFSELYPGLVGSELWDAYLRVQATGEPAERLELHYRDKQAGVVAESRFTISAHPVLGGLLVAWQRVDEDQRRLANTELLGNLGSAEYDLITGRSEWTPGMYRIFERDPACGPMSRAEQAAAMVAEDRGLAETAWQTMDAGANSDVTVRFRIGGTVKHLRILSDIARDADGAPVKVSAVVQDVTAQQDSRTAMDRLRDQLRTRELSALAEHRLAGQLQHLIQPVPAEPFRLAGLEATVSYLPAESAVRVGGDWYHAQTLPDGRVLLAVGDVAGHGLAAASGMAHLRYALAAWLSIGIREPGQLLTHANRLCRQLDITGTAVLASYEPATRTLCWARAGHMPPLLARRGTATELPRPPGVLLGARDGCAYPERAVALEPGDVVLFYTDGLVERRESGAEDVLERVKRDLCAVAGRPAADRLARLRQRLHTPSTEDDTCTLAVRVLP
jgi:serine phosphatase RsbU (regulator of sigma subunit)